MIRDLRNLRLWGGVRRGGEREAACAVRAFKTTDELTTLPTHPYGLLQV